MISVSKGNFFFNFHWTNLMVSTDIRRTCNTALNRPEDKESLMPAKNHTTRPQQDIERFVRRHLDGEQAVSLAREAKISKAGFYLWVRKYKYEMLEKSKQANMSPHDIDAAEIRRLQFANAELKQQNAKLRNKLVDYMLKHGDM